MIKVKPDGQHGNKGSPKANAIVARRDARDRIEEARTHANLAVAGRVPFKAGSLPPEDGVDVTRRLGLMDIGNDDCRWISGDPMAEHSFCGKPVQEGSSWCPEHHARVYIKARSN